MKYFLSLSLLFILLGGAALFTNDITPRTFIYSSPSKNIRLTLREDFSAHNVVPLRRIILSCLYKNNQICDKLIILNNEEKYNPYDEYLSQHLTWEGENIFRIPLLLSEDKKSNYATINIELSNESSEQVDMVKIFNQTKEMIFVVPIKVGETRLLKTSVQFFGGKPWISLDGYTEAKRIYGEYVVEDISCSRCVYNIKASIQKDKIKIVEAR